MAPKFSLTEDNKGRSLAVFYSDGECDTISETHVSFEAILEKIIKGSATDEEIRELARVRETLARKMSSLSERVSVDGMTVYFDGDEIRGEVSDIIKSLFIEGRDLDFKPLVNFLEKASTNPSLESVDDLYRWIRAGDLVIDPEGYIIAYKAVKVDENGVGVSIHAGKAFVNGQEFEGNIPNVPGTVITMPRSEVDPKSFNTCSYGLHAGTYAYASKFASWQSNGKTRIALVKINPRDVVSVPTDHADSKMRVSRYVVVSQTDHRLESRIYKEEQPSVPEQETLPTLDNPDGLRDSKGRFTKAAAAGAKRDSKGRFIK